MKKILSLLLGIVLVLTLVGCGEAKKVSTKETITTTENNAKRGGEKTTTEAKTTTETKTTTEVKDDYKEAVYLKLDDDYLFEIGDNGDRGHGKEVKDTNNNDIVIFYDSGITQNYYDGEYLVERIVTYTLNQYYYSETLKKLKTVITTYYVTEIKDKQLVNQITNIEVETTYTQIPDNKLVTVLYYEDVPADD